MRANEYQKAALETAIFRATCPDNLGHQDTAVLYAVLGLVGEAGEVAEKVKKIIREGGYPEVELRGDDSIKKELGDVAWYLSVLCSLFGFGFDEVLEANIEKLSSRKKRGVLRGDGDDR